MPKGPRHLADHDDWLKGYHDVLVFAATWHRLPSPTGFGGDEAALAAWVQQQRTLHSVGSEALTRHRCLLLERIPEWKWMDEAVRPFANAAPGGHGS